MKKLLIALGAVIVAAVVLGGIGWLIFPYRIYPFDRIKGNITVTVDGQPVEVVFDSTPDGTSTKEEDNVVKVSTKGGEYGTYEYVISAGAMKTTFEINHSNSWYVTKFDLVIEYHSDSDGMIYTLDAETSKEEPQHKTDFITNGGKISYSTV